MNRAILSVVGVITAAVAGYFLFTRLAQAMLESENRLLSAIEGDRLSKLQLDRRIDEASDDSFPASDPPAHRTIAATRGPVGAV